MRVGAGRAWVEVVRQWRGGILLRAVAAVGARAAGWLDRDLMVFGGLCRWTTL